MTKYQMKKIRTLGKRYARATAVAHNEALNILAKKFGLAHWKALTDAVKEDWQPSEEALAKAKAYFDSEGV